MKEKTGRKNILRKVKRKGELVWNEPIQDFFKALKLGMSNQKACEYAGFSDDSLYIWLNKAEQDLEEGIDSIYVEFFGTYKKSKADCQAFHLSNIASAAKSGVWQASAWMLERIFPGNFSQSTRADRNDEEKIEVINDVPNTQ